MLSTLKLLATALLLSSVVSAYENAKIEEFLTEKFEENPKIESVKVEITQKTPIKQLAGWDALIVSVDAMVKAKPKNKPISQRMMWFTNGSVITKELTSIESGDSIRDEVNPKFLDSYYTHDNLIYGKTDAKYKVAIFSDPLCPFCNTYVPKAIEEMKEQPEKFAVYYYHFPLPALHPASVYIAQAAIAAELEGIKNVALRIYGMKINPKEKNLRKILDVVNRKLGTDLRIKDIQTKEVQERYRRDLKIAESVLVQGTPTVFFNGELDRSKRRYEKVK